MRLALLTLLAVLGGASVMVGVALIYPPVALILFGAACVALAFLVEVRDT